MGRLVSIGTSRRKPGSARRASNSGNGRSAALTLSRLNGTGLRMSRSVMPPRKRAFSNMLVSNVPCLMAVALATGPSERDRAWIDVSGLMSPPPFSAPKGRSSLYARFANTSPLLFGLVSPLARYTGSKTISTAVGRPSSRSTAGIPTCAERIVGRNSGCSGGQRPDPVRCDELRLRDHGVSRKGGLAATFGGGLGEGNRVRAGLRGAAIQVGGCVVLVDDGLPGGRGGDGAQGDHQQWPLDWRRLAFPIILQHLERERLAAHHWPKGRVTRSDGVQHRGRPGGDVDALEGHLPSGVAVRRRQRPIVLYRLLDLDVLVLTQERRRPEDGDRTLGRLVGADEQRVELTLGDRDNRCAIGHVT